MSLKCEPSSELLHISVKLFAGLVTCWRARNLLNTFQTLSPGLLFNPKSQTLNPPSGYAIDVNSAMRMIRYQVNPDNPYFNSNLGTEVETSSSSSLLSSLEFRDTQVHEPQIRALLRTASHFCEIDCLKPHPLNLETWTV